MFAEFGMGLVDEGLFCLELGAEGGFGFCEECGYCWEGVSRRQGKNG